MTSNELKVLLKETIEAAFANADDEHYKSVLESVYSDLETKGYSVSKKTVNDGDWSVNGKYEYLEGAVTCFTLEGHKFYVEFSQSRSGSYYSDYYYNDPQIESIETEEEYNAPTEVVSFMYKGHKIIILSNGGAKMENGTTFSTVELAIDTVNH